MRRDRAGRPVFTGHVTRGHAGTCESAAESIPALAGDDASVPGEIRDHVSMCLRCQAEVARYRRMVRDLRALHGDRLVPPPESVSQTLSALAAERRDRRRAARSGAVVVGGAVATAGAAAGVAGMLVWRSRRRILAG